MSEAKLPVIEQGANSVASNNELSASADKMHVKVETHDTRGKLHEMANGIESLSPEFKQAFLEAWSKAVAGKSTETSTGGSEADYINALKKVTDNELEDHLVNLAKQQGKTLTILPEGTDLTSPAGQLACLENLTRNINAVQNANNACITPRLSRELNGMDCSMSTWTMLHELKKAGINAEFGAPVGHAVGIVTIGGERYYADGQKGFVVKIDSEDVPISEDSRIVKIKNADELFTQLKTRGEVFFPNAVFVSEKGGVAATMTNLDSMLYKQYTGEITDEVRQEYGPDIRYVEQLAPYAREYQGALRDFQISGTDKSPVNEMIDTLTPDISTFRKSPEAKADQARLNGEPNPF